MYDSFRNSQLREAEQASQFFKNYFQLARSHKPASLPTVVRARSGTPVDGDFALSNQGGCVALITALGE